ncbi:hypothetical protein AN958_07376 [Leucoagaricus sp. SymC.cos]|nr:hypothetical protein AN958_07376 [Leucoagaricus sp. SymC.cos]
MSCPSENQVVIDQSKFWDSNGIHWTPHRIGWAIAGGCAALTLIISMISVLSHCRQNYTNPPQQRQILRILYMPPVYAIISFASYRFFRNYTYYSFIQIAYEARLLSLLSVYLFLLLIEYVAATAVGNSAERALERKDKRPLPIPVETLSPLRQDRAFCFWRYRPTKPYFMHTVKWSVLQYVIIRPATSIAGIICEKFNVLCHQAGFSPHWANVYLECIDFVSISIALYGLLVFYGLTAEELKDRRPMAKFLAIKLIVMFTFYQSFIFSALEKNVIHETEYWTKDNIANGLDALAICIEMVFFSLFMVWAYTSNEYKREGKPHTGIGKPLLDSINFSDFAAEIVGSLRYYWSTAAYKSQNKRRPDLAEAFGSHGPRSSTSGPGFSTVSDRTPVLHAMSPVPFSSPSPPHDEVHIPLAKMESAGYRKDNERYSPMGIAQ